MANYKRKPATRKATKKGSSFQKWLNQNTSKLSISLTAIIAVVLIVLIVMISMTLSYDKVYDGIYLNGDCISYMSKEELQNYIEEKYSNPISNITIGISAGEKTWELDAADLNITFNIDTIVDSIYNYGHKGSIWERLSEIYKIRTEELHINVFEPSEDDAPLVYYDEAIVDRLASDIVCLAPSTVVQHQVQVENGQVSILAGSNGYSYDLDTVKNALLLAVNEFKSMQVDMQAIASITLPDALDMDATLAQMNIAPVDATFKKVSAKELTIAEEQYGLSVTRADLEAAIAKLPENQGATIPVTATKLDPKVFAKDLEMPTYPDILGEKTTKFGTSSSYKNRNTNLKVATDSLNGYILLPGEQFSFNTYIGDTTLDKGYKLAAGYSNGKVVDTPGGGICQVSTTLYNAVINSVNVDVNARSNHSYTVSYVPKGLDCMINYNSTDFKFTNNTNHPIKIEGIYDNSGKLTYRILGINEHKDISYEFISTQTSSTEPTVIYTKDPAQVQKGQPGGKWSVVRVTYQNGVEIKREAFSKSSYKAMNQYVLEPVATPTPVPTEPPMVMPAP